MDAYAVYPDSEFCGNVCFRIWDMAYSKGSADIAAYVRRRPATSGWAIAAHVLRTVPRGTRRGRTLLCGLRGACRRVGQTMRVIWAALPRWP